ncbi:MAG TPA: PAS domain S-box protein, partial [Gammaproteobacteria bacterium]|nr:PAS domain S-box protein [Gammaproteobacteria bacterium]
LIHPEDRDRVWTEIQEAVTKNRSYETTYRIHDAQGRLRWVWERGRPVTRPGESAPHLEGFITDITAAREAAETRDRLSAVLEATPDFVAMIDPEDRTFYLNPAGRRLLGYEGEAELPGISIEDYHPRPLRKWTVEEVLPEARRKGTWQGEHVLLARDGTEIPVSGVIVAHFRDSGELDFYSAVFRDIRHLKETQEGLARERDFIDAVVENMPGLFGVITPNGKLVRWNRTLERVTGHSTESLASTWTADLFPAEQRTYLRATVQQAMEEGEASVELNLVGADGGLVPYDIECYLVTIASRPYLVGFGYDLTKRKALEAAREQLAEILEATPDYVSIVDPHGHILYLNPAAKELLGRPADQAPPPQWNAFDSHPPQEAERLLKEAFPTAREKGWWEGETKFLRHDGTEVPMAQIILTHRDPKGEVAWYSTIARDLTKHKEAEELARRRLGELAHASRLSTAGEMATQLAHELNQPLAAITAYSQACLNYFERPEPDYPMLRNILGELQNQSQRAGQIITHLRALVSRDQSRWRPVELNTLLDNVLKLVEVETAAKGARVATAYTPDLPPIHGDPVLVEQVALNLIRNAADAVAEAAENGDFEGRIEVETEPLEPNQARVSVRDNGPGLSDEDLERVFEPYYTSKPNGMGLGLRISQSIVEAHGGKLWAEHNPGGGAVFRFTLPCLQPDNGEEEEADGGNTGPM